MNLTSKEFQTVIITFATGILILIRNFANLGEIINSGSTGIKNQKG
jgi:hypothetical protein